MSSVQCRIPESLDDVVLTDVSRVMQHLRPQFTIEELNYAIQQQWQAGYRLAIASVDGAVVGVAGFVVGQKLAWGKHMYIDDLVVDEVCRGQGIGDRLLTTCQQHAASLGCESSGFGYSANPGTRFLFLPWYAHCQFSLF